MGRIRTSSKAYADQQYNYSDRSHHLHILNAWFILGAFSHVVQECLATGFLAATGAAGAVDVDDTFAAGA